MKKIIIFFLLLLSFWFFTQAGASCSNYDGDGDIGAALDGCIGANSKLVTASDYMVEGGFKEKIQDWTTGIAGVLWLLAVGAIVYGALLMTLSNGDEEKISKWKEVVKWAILWFLWVVTAAWLIAIVVNFLFALG